MAKYTKEQVIIWLELVSDATDVDIADEEGLAQAAIEYIKATMPVVEGDDA
jgi:hypothetical protein